MSPALTALIVLVLVEATISTLGVTLILRHALVHRRLPTIAGRIHALAGPFEALGLDSLIVAGLVFVAVSALKFLAAYWLGAGSLDGAVLQLILLAVSTIFWYGFAVPYGPVLGIPQVLLIALVWPDLT